MNKHRVESEIRIAGLFAQRGSEHDWAADSATIHRLARGASSRAERECNEDLGCRKCDGSGELSVDRLADAHELLTRGIGHRAIAVCQCRTARAYRAAKAGSVCPKCDGTGSQLGKRDRRAAERAREIAKRYGMRLYEQSDPRGCPYYLIPDEKLPEWPETEKWSSVNAWIDSNYNSVGVAVHP